jgi:hypothetical protein
MAKEYEIQATDLTLLFKHGHHTILLFATPLTPFSTIKTELLTTLHERYSRGLPSSTSPTPIVIPSSILDVVLGLPIDVYEPSKGWEEIISSGSSTKDTPKSLGLKDGSVLAFAFREGEGEGDGEAEFSVEWSSYDEQYGDGEERGEAMDAE